MRHRITVLGAGYAGASAAGNLARHLHPGDFEITVVTAIDAQRRAVIVSDGGSTDRIEHDHPLIASW